VAVATLLLSLTLSPGGSAWASTFTVSRVQVYLSSKNRSEILTVRNSSSETLRFQLRVFAWDESPQGEMILNPTGDIVFFPQLFTLAPAGERNVRVGTATPPGSVEKTYRLFIEELPQSDGSAGAPAGEVRILTRLGIPIFLQPPRGTAQGRIEDIAVGQGRVSFQVRNAGTVHFVAKTIRITGLGDADEPVVQGALEGWYILAGRSRLFELELPEDKCPRVRSVLVELNTPETVVTGRLEASSGSCRR
jgi:fimbrial chaperone protein